MRAAAAKRPMPDEASCALTSALDLKLACSHTCLRVSGNAHGRNLLDVLLWQRHLLMSNALRYVTKYSGNKVPAGWVAQAGQRGQFFDNQNTLLAAI